MKRYLILIAVVVLSCKKDDPALQTNQILANPEMELGTTIPDNWGFNKSPADPFVSAWSSTAFSGTHSLSISTDTATPADDPNAFSLWTQVYYNDAKVVAGLKLTLSAKVKGDNLVGKGVSVAIRADAPGSPGIRFATSQSTVINGTFDWTTHTISITDIPYDVTVIRVYLIYQPGTTGTAYFDDVKLVY